MKPTPEEIEAEKAVLAKAEAGSESDAVTRLDALLKAKGEKKKENDDDDNGSYDDAFMKKMHGYMKTDKGKKMYGGVGTASQGGAASKAAEGATSLQKALEDDLQGAQAAGELQADAVLLKVLTCLRHSLLKVVRC